MGKTKSAAKYKRKIQRLKENSSICYLCRNPLLVEEMTVEHLIPKALGGTNATSNLAVSCQPCNQEKADFLLREYSLYLEYLDYIKCLSDSDIFGLFDLYTGKFIRGSLSQQEKRMYGSYLRAIRSVQKERAI